MFTAFLGIHVKAPAGVSGSQWEDSTRVTFNAPGTPVTVRVEEESAPGSGIWSPFGSQSVAGSATSADIVGYTENGSYRVRFERQGVPSAWTTFSTPDPALSPPAAPTSVTFANNGFLASLSVQPSEPLCDIEWQIRDGGSVSDSGTDTSDGSLSAMGPYTTPTADPAHPNSGRARHTRFSGTGSWASAWTEDTL